MVRVRLGIISDDDASLRAAKAGDVVDVVALRSCLFNPPRARGARDLAARIRRTHAAAEIVPYAWHYVTHGPNDGMAQRASRSLGAVDTSEVGHFRDADGVRRAWEVVRTEMDELGSPTVILSTPPSFSPGSLSRRRLAAFVSAHQGVDQRFVWDVHGLWEAVDAADLAGSLGMDIMLGATDVSRLGRLPDCGLWLRVDGADRGHTDALVEFAEDVSAELPWPLTLMFWGPRAYASLRRVQGRLAGTSGRP